MAVVLDNGFVGACPTGIVGPAQAVGRESPIRVGQRSTDGSSVTKGLANPDIASRLGVSMSAVKCHLEAIYRKLGVYSRAEATALAVDTIAHG